EAEEASAADRQVGAQRDQQGPAEAVRAPALEVVHARERHLHVEHLHLDGAAPLQGWRVGPRHGSEKLGQLSRSMSRARQQRPPRARQRPQGVDGVVGGAGISSRAVGATAKAILATPACLSRSSTRITRPCSTFLSARITARMSLFLAFACRASSEIESSPATARESTRVFPSIVSSTLKTFCTSSPLAALGRSIGMPWETMILAVTMNTISNTSVTSTSGVTLMPLMMSSSSDSVLAISSPIVP